VTYYDELGKRHETTQMFATKREANAWSREREQWLLQRTYSVTPGLPNMYDELCSESWGAVAR